MKIKNVLRTALAISSTLAALTVGIAHAKSYGFLLPEASLAGTVKLEAREHYSVTLNGEQAVIKCDKDKKGVTVPVKVEQGATKYYDTVVETSPGTNPAGPRIIKAIQLGGTKTRLVIAE